jgi:hyaluronan synthase
MSKIVGVEERRRHPRVKFESLVRVAGNGRKGRKAVGRDISFGGCSFYVNKSVNLAKNEWIEIAVTPPEQFVDTIFDSRCKIKGRIARTIGWDETDSGTDNEQCVAVEFEKDLRDVVKEIYKSRRIGFSLILLLVLLGILGLKFLNVEYYWYQPVLNVYSLTVTGYIISRFLLSFFYRPPKDTGFTPTISFVIPVKNDEHMIGQTISRCFSADYPREKFEIIVVNDGSTDNTLAEIRKAEKLFPGTKVINFEKNKGKRYAMAAAFRVASSEVLICIDSDSLVSRDSVRYIVQGFADPSVGAVCGHARVLNADKSSLAKMQEVRYYLAFQVIKAAEHIFSAVTCCSGCLSAYRRSYVMDILDSWLGQKWFGEPATFGDDRSLTNYMLRKYRVLYDARAVVETAVPETWFKFFKQQLRWKKSWFRESLIASTFIWYKHPIMAILFYLGVLLPLVSPLIVFGNFIYKPIVAGILPMYYVMGFGLISLLYSLYYALRRPNTKWPYGLMFCLVYMAVLAWQTYYAILTSHKNHWGTR